MLGHANYYVYNVVIVSFIHLGQGFVLSSGCKRVPGCSSTDIIFLMVKLWQFPSAEIATTSVCSQIELKWHMTESVAGGGGGGGGEEIAHILSPQSLY